MLGYMIFVIKWWLYILLIGILFLPVAQKVLCCFFDRGYGFSKIIGILTLSYSSWLLSIHSIILPLALIPAALLAYKRSNTVEFIKENKRIILFEELLFLGMLLSWCYVRGLQPDIYGLEKYMDFGFVNAILPLIYGLPERASIITISVTISALILQSLQASNLQSHTT